MKTGLNFKLKYPNKSNILEGDKDTLFMALYAMEKGGLSGNGFDSFNLGSNIPISSTA